MFLNHKIESLVNSLMMWTYNTVPSSKFTLSSGVIRRLVVHLHLVRKYNSDFYLYGLCRRVNRVGHPFQSYSTFVIKTEFLYNGIDFHRKSLLLDMTVTSVFLGFTLRSRVEVTFISDTSIVCQCVEMCLS